MEPPATSAPRSVRVLELGEDGAPVHQGLLAIEVGTRLVFSVRPNPRIDLVRREPAGGGDKGPRTARPGRTRRRRGAEGAAKGLL